MGRGKSDEAVKAREHMSRPLSSLKDPASFGPPPKNVNYHGGAALPNEITPQRGGLGAPLTQSQIAGASTPDVEPEEDVSARRPVPNVPYRADRTGLSTANLPPPPTHHNIREAHNRAAPPALPPASSQPRLPPRLPSRTTSTDVVPAVENTPPPSYYNTTTTTTKRAPSYINNSAVERLGNAGVKVPALGIGSASKTEANPWTSEQSRSSTTSSGLSELQSRFSRLNSSSSPAVVAEPAYAQTEQSASNAPLPSWKSSQSALMTANQLHKDPSKVTVADAQSAAQTANQMRVAASSFREKHADSIAKGQMKAKAWDQKYKVTSKLNKFLDEHTDPEPNTQQQPGPSQEHQAIQTPHAHYTNGPGNTPAQGHAQATPTPLPPPTWSSAVPQHATTTAYQPVQSPPPQIAEMPASPSPAVHRKPPPPPPPSKPQSMKAPPPVPTQTKPTFG